MGNKDKLAQVERVQESPQELSVICKSVGNLRLGRLPHPNQVWGNTAIIGSQIEDHIAPEFR
jgi:hypothetical protein